MSTVNRPKRALFNKPSWAAKTTIEVPDTTAPVFGQNVVYEDIVAAEKKRREKHAQRAKERAENEREKAEKSKRQAVKVGDTKRRRISNDDLDQHVESGNESDERSTRSAESVSKDSNHSPSESRTSSPSKERPVLRSTLQKEKEEGLLGGLESSRVKPQVQSNSRRSTTIVLDGEEGNRPEQQDRGAHDSSHHVSHWKQVSKAIEPEPESEEEDEYLRELKRKAREEARTTRARGVIGKEGTPDVHGRATPRSPSQAQEDSIRPQSNSRATSAAPDPEDPKVEIFIRTMIPGAREMVVARHASQPLDKVKEFWCQRNGLHPAIASKVFFTWNGTRLFNSTTMRSIIVRLKKLHPTPDGSDPSMGKIEIEAMTEEILQHRQKQKERRKMQAAGLSGPQGEEEEGKKDDDDLETQNDAGPSNGGAVGSDQQQQQPLQQQPPEKTGIIIKLTSPGIEDMMLRLRPNTTVAKILSGFRKIKKIDPGRECWLVFDGERLEDTQTVDEVEFEHEDTVEVHIR